jgi:hypothetical protein
VLRDAPQQPPVVGGCEAAEAALDIFHFSDVVNKIDDYLDDRQKVDKASIRETGGLFQEVRR